MGPILAPFVIIMTAILTAGYVLTSWTRSRGPAAAAGNSPDAVRQIELLSAENAELKGQVSRLEERLSVLERIATDPAERTAREIENLR